MNKYDALLKKCYLYLIYMKYMCIIFFPLSALHPFHKNVRFIRYAHQSSWSPNPNLFSIYATEFGLPIQDP